MTALTTLTASQASTMSSREIAELTGKEHRNVMADIRKMLLELHGEDRLLSFQQTVDRPNPSGGCAIKSVVFILPKRETLILVSGYSVAMRAKIIDRWHQLEAGAAPTLNLRQPGQMLAVAMQLAEICQEQQNQLAAQAPKVRFAEAVGEAENLQKIGEVAKALGTGSRRLWAFLRDSAILMANDLPYQSHLEANRFKVVEVPYTDHEGAKRIKLETRVTGKGVTFLQQRLIKSREVTYG